MTSFRNVCCICIQKYLNLQNINDSDENNVKYSEKLKVCVPNEIWYEDYNICENCIEKLDAAYNFVQGCFKTEETRKQKLKSDSVVDKNSEIDIFKDDIADELFYCDHCGKSFKLKRFLSIHITRTHCKKKLSKTKRKETKKESEAIVKSETEFVVNSEEPELVDFERKLDLKTENNKENDEANIESTRRSKEKINYNENESDLDETFDDNNDNSGDYSSETEEEDIKSDTIKQPGKKRGPKVKQPLKCDYCEAQFQKRQLWAAHIRSKHTFEKPFACDQCEARYMNAYSLLIHKRKHNNEKPFICASCGKSFVSSADLNHHNKIHNLNRAYPCPDCDRSFKTHSNLRTHKLQMHLDPAEWKFPCTLCDKKFPIKGNLVKHLKRHAGIKDFPCHICDKKFINKAELNLHINSHTNERLYKCNICLKEYKNREGLRRHMKVVHDLGNWKAPKPIKKYLCPMCPKIFAFTNKLQRHIFTHTGEKPFKCDYCAKRFIDNYSRKVHLKKDHNIEYF